MAQLPVGGKKHREKEKKANIQSTSFMKTETHMPARELTSPTHKGSTGLRLGLVAAFIHLEGLTGEMLSARERWVSRHLVSVINKGNLAAFSLQTSSAGPGLSRSLSSLSGPPAPTPGHPAQLQWDHLLLSSPPLDSTCESKMA